MEAESTQADSWLGNQRDKGQERPRRPNLTGLSLLFRGFFHAGRENSARALRLRSALACTVGKTDRDALKRLLSETPANLP